MATGLARKARLRVVVIRFAAGIFGFANVTGAGAGSLWLDTVRLAPNNVTVESSPTLPPEFQSLETQMAPAVFDRNALREHTAHDGSRFTFPQISAALQMRSTSGITEPNCTSGRVSPNTITR